jgi:tRNA dimethylallyltransferase
MSRSKKYLIVIGGPTGVGKTALSIALAKHFNCEILSADSRQFYQGMDIGTAKATPEEQAEAAHHFIDFLDISQDYSIGDFERDALVLVEKLHQISDFAILVGGSGMYIRALCEGLDYFPTVSEDIKNELERLHAEEGLESLQKKLQELDNESFEALDIQNPNRVKRALGVCMAGEKPFSFYKNQDKKERNFTPIYLALDLPREELYAKINQRVWNMVSEGLEKEAQFFFQYKEKNALQTVGYQEFFEFFEQKISYERAIELIQQHTRNYAKRQLTWFRNQSNFTFFRAHDVDAIVDFIEKTKHNI